MFKKFTSSVDPQIIMEHNCVNKFMRRLNYKKTTKFNSFKNTTL